MSIAPSKVRGARIGGALGSLGNLQEESQDEAAERRDRRTRSHMGGKRAEGRFGERAMTKMEGSRRADEFCRRPQGAAGA